MTKALFFLCVVLCAGVTWAGPEDTSAGKNRPKGVTEADACVPSVGCLNDSMKKAAENKKKEEERKRSRDEFKRKMDAEKKRAAKKAADKK